MVTDVELPVPITMGIVGRAVSGKRTLLENFVVKLNGEACGVTCPNIGRLYYESLALDILIVSTC